MIWVAWRQQRSIFVAFAGAAIIFALWLIIAGQHEQSLWNQYLAPPCNGGFGATSVSHYCEGLQTAVYAGTHVNDVATIIGTMFAPLLGLILGVNAVAREIEQKTNRLAWTQSKSRSKWLASKYLASVAMIVAIGAPLCLVLSWWVRASHDGARIAPKAFAISGFVELGYGVFCFALAVIVGLVFRRAGWSLAVCVILFAGLYLSFADQIRPHLVTPSVTTVQTSQIVKGSTSGFYTSGGAPADSWFLYEGMEPVTTKGVPSLAFLEKSTNAMYRCGEQRRQGNYCEQHLHLRNVEVFVADNRFWTLQLEEGSAFLGFAVVLAGLAFWGIRRIRA